MTPEEGVTGTTSAVRGLKAVVAAVPPVRIVQAGATAAGSETTTGDGDPAGTTALPGVAVRGVVVEIHFAGSVVTVMTVGSAGATARAAGRTEGGGSGGTKALTANGMIAAGVPSGNVMRKGRVAAGSAVTIGMTADRGRDARAAVSGATSVTADRTRGRKPPRRRSAAESPFRRSRPTSPPRNWTRRSATSCARFLGSWPTWWRAIW